MDKRSKISRSERLHALLAAIPKYLKGSKSVKLAGKDYTLAQLASVLREEIDAIKKVSQATAARSSAVAQERSIKARNKPVLVALENLVRGYYGADVQVLTAFRLDPPKKGAKSVQVKKVAAEKAKATREERHTMGPKQKKSVKG